ncbi:MAG: diaminopimelate epimerase [Candidatus Accumulibacter sp.]|jgi:diaminopimelate epimerase|nr:diaminopimelate epimerase [Accumulibacter sp.]
MKLKFSKMHGAGNDFVVFDGVRQKIAPTPELIRCIADRRFGIGCDQVLLVEKSGDASVDFRYRIFNADGGEVEQCGNGARCFARFVHEQGLTDKKEIRVETLKGVIRPRIEDDGNVTVDMGAPVFDPEKIPFLGAARASTAGVVFRIDLGSETVEAAVVSMGNPHAVLVVGDVDDAPVARIGPLVEAHPLFPRRVNAGFMQLVDPHSIRLRVFERGAGETLSCGTGACAAVVAGILRSANARLESPVRVETRGGVLTIAWAGGDASVFMTGPAVTVFTGEIEAFPSTPSLGKAPRERQPRSHGPSRPSP